MHLGFTDGAVFSESGPLGTKLSAGGTLCVGEPLLCIGASTLRRGAHGPVPIRPMPKHGTVHRNELSECPLLFAFETYS